MASYNDSEDEAALTKALEALEKKKLTRSRGQKIAAMLVACPDPLTLTFHLARDKQYNHRGFPDAVFFRDMNQRVIARAVDEFATPKDVLSDLRKRAVRV